MVIDGHRSGRVAPGSMVGQPNMLTLVSFVENQKMMRGFSSQPHPPVEPQNQKTAARQFFVFLADSKIGNPKIV